MAALTAPALLFLLGWLMLWSDLSGRLDILLRDIFHPIVGIIGVILIVLAFIQLPLSLKILEIKAQRITT